MPNRRSELRVDLIVEDGLRVAVDEVELGVALRRAGARMDVRTSEEFRPVVEHPILALVEEILVTEGDDL